MSENQYGKNKGYIQNQGGRNSFSGFRGRHRYLKTLLKTVDGEVKPNNELEDDKLQRGEALDELDLLPIDITDKPKPPKPQEEDPPPKPTNPIDDLLDLKNTTTTKTKY